MTQSGHFYIYRSWEKLLKKLSKMYQWKEEIMSDILEQQKYVGVTIIN